jgi:hypothetical protein
MAAWVVAVAGGLAGRFAMGRMVVVVETDLVGFVRKRDGAHATAVGNMGERDLYEEQSLAKGALQGEPTSRTIQGRTPSCSPPILASMGNHSLVELYDVRRCCGDSGGCGWRGGVERCPGAEYFHGALSYNESGGK